MPLIQKVRPRKIVNIELAAENLLHLYQPDMMERVGIFDVEQFFEFELQADTQIEPVCADLPNGVDGYTDTLGMKCFISKDLWDCGDDVVRRRRLRSTMAHEIGHCYLHVPDARQNRQMQQVFGKDAASPFELYDPDDLQAYEDPEWQAWRFASALLMPQDSFRRAVQHGWTVRQLRDGFDVNGAYVLKRIRELKISKQVRNG
jgi:hypothetical protein